MSSPTPKSTSSTGDTDGQQLPPTAPLAHAITSTLPPQSTSTGEHETEDSGRNPVQAEDLSIQVATLEEQGVAEHIAVDNADWDNDSSLGSDADSTGSASVTSSIFGYKYENGRRYHAYREGTYFLPNDEMEQDRLDLHHHLFRLMLSGELYRAPLVKGSVQNVLDYGTGTGIWSLDFADAHPEAIIIGTDLSPIQPNMVPPNVRFYVDDIESEWTFDERFDYIHGRSMGGSVGNWPLFYERAYNQLVPGGWCESQEFDAWVYSQDDPEMKKAPNVNKWQTLVDHASSKYGKRFNVAADLKQHMIEANFLQVQDEIYMVPIGPWAKDPNLKNLGLYQREHMVLSVEAFTLALFTRILDWSIRECQILIAGVKKELRDPNIHLITIFHFIYGQKPEGPA